MEGGMARGRRKTATRKRDRVRASEYGMHRVKEEGKKKEKKEKIRSSRGRGRERRAWLRTVG
ncbi:hypothetical protein PUN28_010185 [Cardiocondyla obscurior]|uniref:Uncharacterized protein n=1 Tax=Cardiocondyla obscurior TaxID=286306 RepID=A0AAW2FQZ7_9HYME